MATRTWALTGAVWWLFAGIVWGLVFGVMGAQHDAGALGQFSGVYGVLPPNPITPFVTCVVFCAYYTWFAIGPKAVADHA